MSNNSNANEDIAAEILDVSSETISNFEKAVSGLVVIGGLLITLILIWILKNQLTDINTEVTSSAVQCLDLDLKGGKSSTINPRDACLIALEAEAQSLRTYRAQTIVAARLFIQSISILAGISLMTMGSSFVFARIKGPNSSLTAEINMARSDKNGWKVIASSYFPGVILTILGTIIVVSTVGISTYQKSKTIDRPVFLDWPEGSYIEKYPSYYGTGNLTDDEKKERDAGLEVLRKKGIIE